MKSKISVIILGAAIVATACGNDEQENTHTPVVDLGQFSSYVAEFQQEATEQGSPVEITDLIIQFGPMSSSLERGYCQMGGNQSPTIVIDEDYWNSSEEGARKSLLLHELGHCVLNRGHVATLTDQGIPTSLMNPYTISAEIFDYNEAYYWQELFSVRNTLNNGSGS